MDNFLFISYSSKDKAIADAICHFLEENNIPCWIAPRDIQPGETWAGSIVRAIKKCAAMVLVYSQEANLSHQVANEIDKAFTSGKVIIPFMVDSTPMNDDFDYYLSRKHWLVAYPDYREKMKPLLEVVKGMICPLPENKSGKDVKPSKEDADEKEEQQPSETVVAPENEPVTEVTMSSELKPVLSENITEKQKAAVDEILNTLVWVEGGMLHLGATPEQKPFADKDESPAHEVELSSFYMNKYPVIQRLWIAIMGENPSKHKGNDYPVENISYIDAENFISKLNALTGLEFALPTEAQWEFAARGGVKSHGFIFSGSNSFEEVGWNSWDGENTKSVGLKMPNELGLYDMSGNVGEWCCEPKGKYTSQPAKDPKNFYKPSWYNEDQFIYRGGDVLLTESSSLSCRVSYRASLSKGSGKGLKIGLRVVLNKTNSQK